MAEPALTLRDHPQIIDLISVLEQSGLQKQKEEVQALVGYIDGMEEKLSQMMDEMKEMRLEVGKLHDKGIRARCSQLADTVPFPVSWTVKMKKKQKETQDILSYHSQAAGCSDKTRAKASGGRQPIEECGRTGL